MKRLLLLTSISMLMGCTSWKEAVMPFRNFSYSAERSFPVESSDADFAFRASVNFSTNVDRVFTISKDSIFGQLGTLVEIYTKAKKPGKPEVTYNHKYIIPKSGFDSFIRKVDSLNLLNCKSQKEFNIGLHQPFSLFVIELKRHGKYNQFKFNTDMSRNRSADDVYLKVEELILHEFDFRFYFDEQSN